MTRNDAGSTDGDDSPRRPDGGSIRCPDCCLGFESEEALREHAREHHDEEDPLD